MQPDVSQLSHALSWLQGTSFATTVRESPLLFPLIESVHVLALTLVVGSIFIVDLRLLGLASRDRSTADVLLEVLPFTWTAFSFAVLAGAALFTTHAVAYAHNFQFQMKLLLLAFAGINMGIFHWVKSRGHGAWGQAASAPWQGKIAGLLSICLWIGIVAFGRWIGFESIR
jgi:hypothetical protein